MQKRKLGNSGLALAPLAFGGNIFGWTVDEPSSFKLLDTFVAAGFNFIDTADTYSRWAPGNNGGESETIIGKWIKERGNRQNVLIATKVGGDMGQGKIDVSKNYILSEVENSLKRLQTDYIDLYQTHYDNPEIPVEETLEAYSALMKAGKIRAIGASNFTPQRLLDSFKASEEHGYPRYESLQPLYNLYDRELYEKNFRPIVKQKGIGVINYYALASGFLTGKYRSENDLSKSKRGQGVKKYFTQRGFRILKALDEVSKKFAAPPSAIAIAWLLAHPEITAPIASATTTAQLKDVIKGTELTLDDASFDLLNQASAYLPA